MTDKKPRITIEAQEHSRTGASGANRWMNCPGSLNLIEKLGDDADKAGMDAAYGTVAHELAARCLANEQEPWEYADYEFEVEDRYVFAIDADLMASAQMFIDTVHHLLKKYADKKPILHIERQMQSPSHPDAFGTADVSIEVPGEVLIILDLKNGMVNVEVDGEQTRYYGALGIELLEGKKPVKKVTLVIVQPRAFHHQGPVRSMSIAPDDLTTWFEDEVLPAIEATKEKDAHLAIGSWCRWCNARGHCPAIKSETMHFNLDVEPIYLTDDELELVKRKYDQIKQYGEKYLDQEIFRRAKSGVKFTHFKLVDKSAKRIFKDTVKVGKRDVKVADFIEKNWGDAAYDRKLKGPAQIEKLPGGKSFVAKAAYKPKVGYTIAARSDSKAEVKTIMDQSEELEM